MMKPNPEKPEKVKIFKHEITKERKHEKDQMNDPAASYGVSIVMPDAISLPR